jgi:hypothetical protein
MIKNGGVSYRRGHLLGPNTTSGFVAASRRVTKAPGDGALKRGRGVFLGPWRREIQKSPVENAGVWKINVQKFAFYHNG